MRHEPREYYWYQLGGWVIAVDGVSHQDAAQKATQLMGDRKEYLGHYSDTRNSVATGVITPKRQEQISDAFARWMAETD